MGTKKRNVPIKILYPDKNETTPPPPAKKTSACKGWTGNYPKDPRHNAPTVFYGINNILRVVTELPRSRPFQIFEAYLTIEIRFMKNEFYLCFDGIRNIPVYQQIYKGRRSGLPPSEIHMDLNPHPKCPGKYAVLLRFEQDGKNGTLKVTQASRTWKCVA